MYDDELLSGYGQVSDVRLVRYPSLRQRGQSANGARRRRQVYTGPGTLAGVEVNPTSV